MDDEKTQFEKLLREYEVCSSRADNLTTIIWQPFTLFLGASGIGLGLLVQVKVETVESLLLVTLFTSAIIYIFSLWTRVANKWNMQQSALYKRLDTLEKALGFHTNLATKDIDIKNPKLRNIRAVRHEMTIGISCAWSFYLLLISLVILFSHKRGARHSNTNLKTWALFTACLGGGLLAWKLVEYWRLRKVSKELKLLVRSANDDKKE
jgi:heme/copper-type cytochrome/quinol oxidase subunit 3